MNLFIGCEKNRNNNPIKILILSGKNNHEWQKTTPVLEKMYQSYPVFSIKTTEKSDSLSYKELKNFAVIVSNWNTWPDTSYRWDREQEKSFEKYVREGGNAVFIHAGASSFYGWEAYHQIGIGRWGNETSHGEQTKVKVIDLSQSHPITKGINDFYLLDEIWEDTDTYPDAIPIGYVNVKNDIDNHDIYEPAFFVNQFGKGRSFYTILGHNERALFNTGLQTLLLRATEWIATGQVSIDIPLELKLSEKIAEDFYRWDQTDTTFALYNNTDIMWQYNFNNRFGKPYFHPIYFNDIRITCESPADHPWHHGLWFTWKFINKINYWEFMNDYKSEKTGYRSEGKTEITDIKFQENSDYSADIQLFIQYHPGDKSPVMEEKRIIHICAPVKDGKYYFDYDHTFTALSDSVVLDRTPIPGEPDGKSWGGYGGLSIRFNQDFTVPYYITQIQDEGYPKGGWFFMSFTSITGMKAGVAMFQHPEFTTAATRWYYINDPFIPFFYFSPAALYDNNIVLKKGEILKLKYRIWILGKSDKETINSLYNEFISE